MNPKILASFHDAGAHDGLRREVALPAATKRHYPLKLSAPRPIRQIVVAHAKCLGHRGHGVGGLRGHEIHTEVLSLDGTARRTVHIFRHVTNE